MSRRDRTARGASLAELLVVLALAGLLVGMGSLALASTARRQGALGAARGLAADIRFQRSVAIAQGRSRGLVLRELLGEWQVSVVADGDGDGLRADDRRLGRDPLLEGPMSLSRRYGPVAPGFLPALDGLRTPPPGSRPLIDFDDPVRFGRSDVIAAGPGGGTSSGTIYLTDGASRQLAVVVAGSTGRVRLLEWDRATRSWQRR
ncbi:MAG: hypothetical protein AAF533_12325 [Acidobacteriota bacterium]